MLDEFETGKKQIIIIGDGGPSQRKANGMIVNDRPELSTAGYENHFPDLSYFDRPRNRRERRAAKRKK